MPTDGNAHTSIPVMDAMKFLDPWLHTLGRAAASQHCWKAWPADSGSCWAASGALEGAAVRGGARTEEACSTVSAASCINCGQGLEMMVPVCCMSLRVLVLPFVVVAVVAVVVVLVLTAHLVLACMEALGHFELQPTSWLLSNT